MWCDNVACYEEEARKGHVLNLCSIYGCLVGFYCNQEPEAKR